MILFYLRFRSTNAFISQPGVSIPEDEETCAKMVLSPVLRRKTYHFYPYIFAKFTGSLYLSALHLFE